MFGCGGSSPEPVTPADVSDVEEGPVIPVADLSELGDPLDVRLAAIPEADMSVENSPKAFRATAAGMMAFGTLHIAEVSNAKEQAANGCPSLTDDGAVMTLTADGCTVATDNPFQRHGVARAHYTMVDGRQEIHRVEFEEWGQEKQVDCAGTTRPSRSAITGSVETTEGSMTLSMFREVIGMERERDGSCSVGGVTVIRYSLTTREDANGRDVWNGSGTIGGRNGRAEFRTVDEVTHRDTCAHEPLSGQTIVRAGGHEAVVTYDGETACDQPGSANWTLDGQDQGATEIARCAVGGDPAGFLPALIALLFVRRRRS